MLARLQRERQTLTDEIDREVFSSIGGDYDLRPAAQGGCKDLLRDAFGPVSVIQKTCGGIQGQTLDAESSLVPLLS